MPKRKVTRKELLKEPDEFITTTTRTLEFVRRYSRWITVAVIAVIVVGVAAWGWRLHQNRRERRAQELQAQAYQLYRKAVDLSQESSSRELFSRAVDRFQEVIQKYTGTQASLIARIYRGHSAYAIGRHEEAVHDYEMALAEISSEGLRALTLQGLGFALMGQGNFEQAIKAFEELKQVGGAGFKRTAEWNIARCLEKQGKTNEALEIYQNLEETFQDMFHQVLARAKIRELKEPATSP